MFSLSQRFQTITNTAITLGVVIIAFIVSTSWIQLYFNDAFHNTVSIANIRPKLNIRTSRYYGSSNGKPKENIKVNFDLDTDLTSLFNWNTKQIFVYLTAEYNNTKQTTSNEVTFWDKIITDPNDAILNLTNVKSKYNVWDVSENLSGKDLNFKLNWNIQPWVGPLINGHADGDATVSIPKKKKKKVVNEEKKVANEENKA
ncbi:signal peptidase complex subunit 3 [Monosporozyma servazzii]